MTPWTDRIFARPVRPAFPVDPYTIGILEGQGIGPEVIRGALEVLAALETVTPLRFRTRVSKDPVGAEAEVDGGTALSAGVKSFCQALFADGGALLAGPVGGRFVYELRKEFDLFCKLSPLLPCRVLGAASRMKAAHTDGVDILVVRENAGGEYQGRWRQVRTAKGRRAEHSFHYTDVDVRRILRIGALLARDRRQALMVVVKDGGLPALSNLWRDCTREVAGELGVAYRFANVDLAAYLLVQHARDLDVVVAPNLFGDVLADVGGVLLGSRGLSYSGNFADDGAAVYQTNHGGAMDLAGTDRANPVGQIYSLAMLLRESFGLDRAARLIGAAVTDVWRQGWRTADLSEPGVHVIGTREMGARIADAVQRLSKEDAWR